MSISPRRKVERSRAAAGRPPVTAERVLDEALRLTAERGVEGWTLRQLASALDCYPAAIYHRVGQREAVVAGVLDRIVDRIPQPLSSLAWRDWFNVLSTEMRTVLRQHPGAARRFALVGPSVQAAGRLINAGVIVLQRAGFGRESVLTYNFLTTMTCQLVAIEDERDTTHDARMQLAESYLDLQSRTDAPGLAATGELLHELATQPGGLAGYYASAFDYAMQRCLDGAEARLQQLTTIP